MSRANEPVYPVLFPDSPLMRPGNGLTLREHFAGLIYVQFLHGSVIPAGFDASEAFTLTATRAIEAADALIAELEKSA